MVSGFNGFVFLSIPTGNGVLNFNSVVQASNGIATFTGLKRSPEAARTRSRRMMIRETSKPPPPIHLHHCAEAGLYSAADGGEARRDAFAGGSRCH